MFYRTAVLTTILLCILASDLQAEVSDKQVGEAFGLWGRGMVSLGLASFYNSHVAVGYLGDSWVLQKDKSDELRAGFRAELTNMRNYLQLSVQNLTQSFEFFDRNDDDFKTSKMGIGVAEIIKGMTLVIAQTENVLEYIETGEQQAAQKFVKNRVESDKIWRQLIQRSQN